MTHRQVIGNAGDAAVATIPLVTFAIVQALKCGLQLSLLMLLKVQEERSSACNTASCQDNLGLCLSYPQLSQPQ